MQVPVQLNGYYVAWGLHARRQLVNGLSALREKAGELARQDAGHLVTGFGQMGNRRFQLAA